MPRVGEILLYVLAAYLLLQLVYKLFLNHQRKKYNAQQKHTVFSIRVSKENEKGPIFAEQLYANLHGIARKISWLDKLKGVSQEGFSLEIANCNGRVSFYIWCPEPLKNFFMDQIYAQYPEIDIVEVTDYTQKIQTKYACSVELGLINHDIFPIKRYPQFENMATGEMLDPLSGITASLSKLNSKEDAIWLQIVLSPLGESWRHIGGKCASIIHKGKLNLFGKVQLYLLATPHKWMRLILFPFSVLNFFTSALTPETIEKGPDFTERTSRLHDKEDPLSASLDKIIKLSYKASLRITYLSNNKTGLKNKVRELAASFKQFSLPHLNSFTNRKVTLSLEAKNNYLKRSLKKPFVLNIEEIATLYHFPNVLVETPNLDWVQSRKLEPPSNIPTSREAGTELTLLGRTNFRGYGTEFGIKTNDRRRHIYVIGKTGMGKSTLLENMLYSDIMNGKGVAIIDPHGSTADHVLNFIPKHRVNDVVIFDPSDVEYPVSFNLFENDNPEFNSIIASGIVSIFKKLYAESWGPRLEYILRNTILALLESPNTTMLGILRMYTDDLFRYQVVKHVTNPVVRNFWEKEYTKWDKRQLAEALAPIQNKVGQFLSSPIIRNIIGQVKSSINLRFFMDKSKILIANLSKGKIGEDNSALLGSMLITKIQLDAMSRANQTEEERKDFYLYVDEFQNFATDAFASILAEARKYKLNLTLANQYIAQMPETVQDAVFGNVGTVVSFQVGYDDAEYLSKQFEEKVLPNDLLSLGVGESYLKLLIDNIPTRPLSAIMFPPVKVTLEEGLKEKILKVSRERYGKPRAEVEDKIQRWSLPQEEKIAKLEWHKGKESDFVQLFLETYTNHADQTRDNFIEWYCTNYKDAKNRIRQKKEGPATGN